MPEESVLRRAQQDVARLEAEIRKLQAERDRIAAFIELLPRYLDAPKSQAISQGRRLKKEIIGDAVYDLLRERGCPTPLREIFERLTKIGVRIGKAHTRQQLSARLNRDGRFRWIPDRGWWFVDIPLPENTPGLVVTTVNPMISGQAHGGPVPSSLTTSPDQLREAGIIPPHAFVTGEMTLEKAAEMVREKSK